MNILYVADPNSIHDIKWITYFKEYKNVKEHLVVRRHHLRKIETGQEVDSSLNIIGYIPDFSMVRIPVTILTLLRIKNFVKKYKIDIIHILYAEPNALWCLGKSYFDVPIIITCRGTDVLKTIPEAFVNKTFINYFVAPAYKLAFNKADWVTGTSRKQLDSVKRFSDRGEGMAVIRTGVDSPRVLSDTSTFFPLNSKRPYILFPRYIKPIYNHEFSLKAIKLLPEKVRSSYTMVFVGKNSGDVTYQNKIETLIKEVKNSHFEFIEKQSQEAIFELYKKASLVVMTPKSDGSPVSAMEALLCGAKLILGPLDYDKDIFPSEVIKLKSWSEQELADKIVYAINSQKSQGDLDYKLKKRIDLKFNMDQMALLYRRVIDDTEK